MNPDSKKRRKVRSKRSPNPLLKQFARVIKRFDDAWFEPVASGWSRPKRFMYSWSGSITFSVVAGVVLANQWLIDLSADSDLRLLFGFTVLALVAMSAWFAWLVSWRNENYNPIRLFVSGLVLPAFVWTLVEFVIF